MQCGGAKKTLKTLSKKMAKGGIARGCGAVMPDRRKVTKVY